MTKKPEIVKEEDLIKRKDGLYYKKYARVPFTGAAKDFYENNQLKGCDNYKEGEKHGPYEWFYENGQLSSQTNNKDEEPDGPYEIYYENGQLGLRENFKDGERDGLRETYNKKRSIMI